MWTGDAYSDFLLHEAEKERWLRKRPKCRICEEHIQEEDAFFVDDIGWICDRCLYENRRNIDEY